MKYFCKSDVLTLHNYLLPSEAEELSTMFTALTDVCGGVKKIQQRMYPYVNYTHDEKEEANDRYWIEYDILGTISEPAEMRLYFTELLREFTSNQVGVGVHHETTQRTTKPTHNFIG